MNVKIQKIYHNEAWMLNLTGVSMLFLLFLIGGWAYTGTPLPSTQNDSSLEAVLKWSLWLVMVAFVLATIMVWIVRLSSNKKRAT